MTLQERIVARPSRPEAPELPPLVKRTRVRMLGWTLGLLVVAAGATLVVLAMLGGESFEEMYEAESGLAIGAIHAPGYVAPQRWIGESDMTLEEFELRRAIREAFGETRDSTRFVPAAAGDFELRQAIREAFGETRDYTRFVPSATVEPLSPATASDQSPDFCSELTHVGLMCIR